MKQLIYIIMNVLTLEIIFLTLHLGAREAYTKSKKKINIIFEKYISKRRTDVRIVVPTSYLRHNYI